MPPSGDAIRRTNRRKESNTNGLKNGDTSRRKDRRKKSSRRRKEEQNRRLLLVFIASFLLFAAVLFLCRRRPKQSPDDRYGTAKSLRDAGTTTNGKLTITDLRANEDSNSLKDIRFFDPRQFPPLPDEDSEPYMGKGRRGGFKGRGDDEWQSDANKVRAKQHPRGPKVDYTKHNYKYPELIFEPPNDGSYPSLEPMKNIFNTWGQDDLDNPPDTLTEVLQHFDYQNPEHVEVSDVLNCCIFSRIYTISIISHLLCITYIGCNQVQRFGTTIQGIQRTRGCSS